MYMITLESISVSPAELQASMTLPGPQASPREGSDNIHTLRDGTSTETNTNHSLWDYPQITVFPHHKLHTTLLSM